jgi:hypothetical protein
VAVAETELLTIDEAFRVFDTHKLDPVLDKAIKTFEATAISFSLHAIEDAATREWYMSNIKRISSEVKIAAAKGEITVRDGAKYCNELRNSIMAEARALSSPHGERIATAKKPTGLTLEQLEKKYSYVDFKKSFNELTPTEQKKVYHSIIEAAGRDDPKFSAATKRMRAAGKVCIVITALIAVHAVYHAENKPKEAIKQGTIIGGGVTGGALGGLGASLVCGPKAWICAIGIIFIGGATGGYIANEVVDSLDDELEEFTQWMTR